MSTVEEQTIESSLVDQLTALCASAFPGMTVHAYIAAHAPVTVEHVLAARGWTPEYLRNDNGRRIVFDQLAILRAQYAREVVAKLKRDGHA
ncbi:hypothetical protein [Caballeronia zhejiangensis]|uniref:Uncharacterized protein n=1 Tax=Caballeronia zhejiangensis TaxID=871203 RepID=A0A656QAZ5_9BURK|nr:hypothetical protein [Caballeronia zhejiangensis]KDR25990.1 hypothetical protein BG60_26320 [Caballeronia zhejiangensis]